MKIRENLKRVAALLLTGMVMSGALWANGGGEADGDKPVELTLLTSQNQNDQLMINALIDAYTAQNPNITFDVEVPPGVGVEIDNLVKLRVAQGDMNDIFYYNCGSLLQTLRPAQTLVDLSGESFMANVSESFTPAVSQGDGIYGVPVGYASAGGILYNKRIYEKLGLEKPRTWEEFAANNETIKAAGISPVLATFGDDWTAQLFVLADFYNVAQSQPNFADDYTQNRVKYSTSSSARRGFEYIQEAYEKGWYQKDFATTRFEQGLQMLAEGSVAHYPMLTQVMNTVATSWPDLVNDIGFFALPGKDVAQNGATLWMPLAFYIPQNSDKVEFSKKFLAFAASTRGTDAINAKVIPAGPYLIKGAKLPGEVLSFVDDLNGYIDSGKAFPALEFLSPVKGPNLQQLCAAVGTGSMTAQEAAEAYDRDVEQQAQQLGLQGW